ncbi:MAG TPA: hypothetical protein DIW31_01235 [Bacteroidales bacterium]|nr:hypothetical protein [Bacteroidales bacterium]
MKIVFETKRLILREFTESDAEFIITLLNSPGWLKYIGDRNVKTIIQAKNYLIEGPLKSYHVNKFGLSMVELKESNKPIGMCGLLKRDYLDNPDIGFAFLPEYEGFGYAFEIASATLEYAKEEYQISNIMAITVPSNTRSIKLLERLGLRFLKNITIPPSSEVLMLFSN